MKPKKTKSKELSIKNQFKEAIKYVKESRNFIYASIIIFIVFSIIGFMASDQLRFLDEILKDLIQKTDGLGTFELIFFILQNNLQSALFSIILGIVAGIFPLGSAIMNGTIMGYVLARTSEVAGFGVWWRLLPHGIFELPAIFISFGLGIKLGLSFFTKKPLKNIKERFYQSLNVMLMIIIPLLIIAAIIEGALIIFLG
ncbi:MAG: stage II sporulation protein M [Nanoarchaeota archaeon]|nr:stage II sporulation protein M [Nanoarchaeota archaeon]